MAVVTPTIHAMGLGSRKAYHRWPLVSRPRPLDDEWRDQAACAKPGVDPEWFFPLGDKSGNGIPQPADWTRARAICGRCDVMAECRAWTDRHEGSLSTSQVFGMFGGEAPLERTSRRRREKAQRIMDRG